MNVYPITFKSADGTIVTGELVTAMTLPTDYWTIVPAGNGVEYSGYPAGNPPQPTWTTLPNLLNQNASVSINILTTYVTPTTGVTLALVGTLPAGWAFNTGTNLLTYNGTSVSGPATVSFVATLTSSGLTAPSNSFTVSGVGSATSDVTAPTIPLGVTISSILQTTATVNWDASADPAPAGTIWSGLAQYNVAVTGAPGSPFTVAAPDAGTQAALTFGDIGPQTSTITQSDADLTFTTTAVDAPFPANSALAAAYYQITAASFKATAKVPAAFSSGAAGDNLRIEVRNNLTGGAAYAAVACTPFNQSPKQVESEYRASINGSATGLVSAAPTGGPIWMQVRGNTGTNVYSFFWSSDGNAWRPLGSTTLALGGTVYVVFGANTQSGGPITAQTLQQCAIQVDPSLSLNLTGLTANTGYSPTITAQDTAGNISAASTAASFTTATSSSLLTRGAPRVAGFYTGGNFLYNNSTMQAQMQHLHAFMFVYGDGFQQAHGFTAASFCQSAKSGAVVPGGPLLFPYYDPIVQNSGPAQSVQSANHLLLVNKYNSDLTNVTTNGGANTIGNPATVGAQPTVTSGTPPTARTAMQYQADYAFDLCFNGGALGLTGAAVAANPYADGQYYDDFNPYTNYSGDWERNNTTQPADSGTNPPGSSAGAQAMRNGWASLCARTRANKPGCLVITDLAGMYVANAVTTGAVGIFDGGIAEAVTGWVNSEDVFANWAQMMRTLQRDIALCTANPILFFNHLNLTSDGRDYYRTTPYQALLYGLCSAMMLNLYYNPNPTGNTVGGVMNMDLTNQKGGGGNVQALPPNYWFDEYCVNPTTRACYGYTDAGIAAGYSWAGQPINDGDPIATPFQGSVAGHNAIYRKRYQMANGHIAHFYLQPRESTGTISVTPGVTLAALSGTQNPSVNNGATGITLFNMTPSTGRIFIQ